MNLEEAAVLLEASDDYRVLRRLVPPTGTGNISTDDRHAIFVDTETDGLDPEVNEIIELTIIPFRYTYEGEITHVGEPLEYLRQPSKPIPPEMTAIHHITDEMVAGRSIDVAEIAEIVAGAAPVVAHHAGFDRPFLEKLIPAFADRPWACSMSQVDWTAEGFDSRALAALATASGFFYDRHRATADCYAAIELLSRSLPQSGIPAMLRLLENGRKTTWRVPAAGSPFSAKDTLKARGYSWNAAEKIWYIDCPDPDAEIAFLRTEIYRRDVSLEPIPINAFNRFSHRI